MYKELRNLSQQIMNFKANSAHINCHKFTLLAYYNLLPPSPPPQPISTYTNWAHSMARINYRSAMITQAAQGG